MIEVADDDDKQRIMLHGYMLVTGVVERSYKHDTETLKTVVRYSFHQTINLDEMKELVAAYCKAAWGADEMIFAQSHKEHGMTTTERMYFHVDFIARHPRRKANAGHE